jgi:hypothetical protein
MSAGESARQEARRARERAEQLTRRAEMFEKGADGESRTADALAALGPEWMVLHDHRWPGRRLANIDHIAIGPGGIFVIESKNWSGDVRVHEQVLRQNGRSREKAVASAADASLAVADLVPSHAHLIRAALCFTQHSDLSGWVRDVMICSPENVARMLTSQPRLLDDAQVRQAALRLDVEWRSAAAERRRTPATSTATRGSRTSPPRRGRSGPRTKSPSAGRLLLTMAAALLLMLMLPTVLPAAATAFSKVFVDQVMSTSVECETPQKRSDRAGTKAQRQGQAADARC